ncbi:MAG TPA: hypothetical protein EYQ50_09195 [Verrucomicrobiales bacterium]|nr:hypothetical protein [Verrucomicrobiales bacterium]HIL68502.1 hypothetical protein [Verrucomicrobiota bacterium]
MDPEWANKNLNTIRTLMERAVVYRRALAAVMIAVGCIGLFCSIIGFTLLSHTSISELILYWMIVGLISLIIGFVLIRRQALKAKEAFWSPPTRRIAQAMLPCMTTGSLIGAAAVVEPEIQLVAFWIPALWMTLFGCAIHAAGFFMSRGIKLFGWLFILLGMAVFSGFVATDHQPTTAQLHLLMGTVFGGGHFAYGIYLHFTENRKLSQ